VIEPALQAKSFVINPGLQEDPGQDVATTRGHSNTHARANGQQSKRSINKRSIKKGSTRNA